MNYKHVITIIGIILAIFAWFINNSTPQSCIGKIICPHYSFIIQGYNKLMENSTLNNMDIGFYDFATYIKKEKLDIDINQIEMFKVRSRTGLRIQTDITRSNVDAPIGLDVILKSGETHSIEIQGDFEDRVHRKIFKKSVSICFNSIFWLGIIVVILGLILEIFKK